jgi:isoquinoline 1-oxidoreductase alpha subunit
MSCLGGDAAIGGVGRRTRRLFAFLTRPPSSSAPVHVLAGDGPPSCPEPADAPTGRAAATLRSALTRHQPSESSTDAACGMSISLIVNGMAHAVDAEPDTPLLWVLRDSLKLTGTKYGCGIAQCGACTVLIDGQATRSCMMPLSAVVGRAVTTIEGLSLDGSHPVQLAWIEFDVPQCGYCQSGQIMAAVSLLKKSMTNICRCGTYLRIRQAIHRAAELQE